MTAWARAGVKCVCVDDSPSVFGSFTIPVGAVVTVVKVNPPDAIDPRYGVFVAEYVSRSSAGFALDRFRPLVTKTQAQDVSLFTHHFDREGVSA